MDTLGAYNNMNQNGIAQSQISGDLRKSLHGEIKTSHICDIRQLEVLDPFDWQLYQVAKSGLLSTLPHHSVPKGALKGNESIDRQLETILWRRKARQQHFPPIKLVKRPPSSILEDIVNVPCKRSSIVSEVEVPEAILHPKGVLFPAPSRYYPLGEEAIWLYTGGRCTPLKSANGNRVADRYVVTGYPKRSIGPPLTYQTHSELRTRCAHVYLDEKNRPGRYVSLPETLPGYNWVPGMRGYNQIQINVRHGWKPRALG